MSNEAIKKLAKIFANQNKILKKLAAPGTVYLDPNSDIASDTSEAVRALTNEPQEMGSFEDEAPTPTSTPQERGGYRDEDKEERNLIMKGYDLMDEAASQSFGGPSPITPEKFEAKLQQYMSQSSDPLFYQTLQQLELLAQRDPRTWGEIGQYFASSGWGPGHIGKLVQKLKSNK